MLVFKILVSGWFILAIAIAVNYLAGKMGVDTWYSFLSEVSRLGFLKTLSRTSILSLIFLFGVYPFILGGIAFFITKYIK